MEMILQKQTNWFLHDISRLEAQRDASQAPFALLNIRTGETVVQRASRKGNRQVVVSLDQGLTSALMTDINVVCAMLEAISNGGLPQTQMARSGLANTYLHICFATNAPEPRMLALEGLASLIEVFLSSVPEDKTLSVIPSEEALLALWSDLHQKPINPGLSDAIICVSGALMAVSLVRARGLVNENLARRLSSWGAMMRDAGMSDRVSPIKLFCSLGGRNTRANQETDLRYSYSCC
jgi:hypothetical protein